MEKTHGKKSGGALLTILALLVTAFYLFPFLLMLLNAFKTNYEFTADPFSLPGVWHAENFAAAYTQMHFGSALLNSLILTVAVCLAVGLIGSLAAYVVSRVKSKLVSAIYFAMIASMCAPFQAYMIPLVKLYSSALGLRNSLVPVAYIATGLNMAFAIFLVRGFLNAIQVEIDQAAMIDGCGPLKMFFVIIMPMLTPILITLLVFVAMGIWNDYLLSSLFLTTQDKRTLPMMQRVFCSEYSTDYASMMAGLLMSVLPMLIFYMLGQRQILEGVVQGSVKG